MFARSSRTNRSPVQVEVIPARQPPAVEVITGRVKWYDPTRGFGFLRADGIDADIYLSRTVLQSAGHSVLAPGAVVEAEIIRRKRSPVVQRVLSVARDPGGNGGKLKRRFAVQGRIRFFDVKNGYGFVVPADGSPDIYLNAATVAVSPFTRLQPGQPVRVEAEITQRGPVAVALHRPDARMAADGPVGPAAD